MKPGIACLRHEPNGVECDLVSIPQFRPLKILRLLSCLLRVRMQEKKLTHVGFCMLPTLRTERLKETHCKVNEDLTLTGPGRPLFGRSCASELSKGCAVYSGTYVIESHHARTDETWL